MAAAALSSSSRFTSLSCFQRSQQVPASQSAAGYIVRVSAQSVDTSEASVSPDSPSTSSSPAPSPSSLFEPSAKRGTAYPGGLGPYTGRDPNVKKPSWLRQRAPQGERYSELKESLSSLKLNTVCEEAQCPNIGEVSRGPFVCTVLSVFAGHNAEMCLGLG